MLKGKLFRQLAWKMATIGVLAVVLLIGATLGQPVVAEFFSQRRLEEIVRNCPQVQAAFGEEAEIFVYPLWLDREREGISKVVIRGDFPAAAMNPILVATVDLLTEKVEVIESREIGWGEWFEILGRPWGRPFPEIPVAALRGKTHGEVLQAIAPTFVDRVPLDMRTQLFALSFDPDPPPYLAELPATNHGRTYHLGSLVRLGTWSDISNVGEEEPGWGREVAIMAGTGIGWPPIPQPCGSLLITYLMFEGRVVAFAWNYTRGTMLFGINAGAMATITEPGKVWAKGLHLVRRGETVELTVTRSDAVFVDLVYPVMPAVSYNKRDNAIEIARAHPMVEEFLRRPALGFRISISGEDVQYLPAKDKRGIVQYVPTDRVQVTMGLVEGVIERQVCRDWTVIVNLPEKRVETIRERKMIFRQGEGFIEIIEERTTYLYPEVREVELIREARRIYFHEDRLTRP